MPGKKNRGENGEGETKNTIEKVAEVKKSASEVFFGIFEDKFARVNTAITAYRGANRGIVSGKLKYTPEEFLEKIGEMVPPELKSDWKRIKRGEVATQLVENFIQDFQKLSNSGKSKTLRKTEKIEEPAITLNNSQMASEQPVTTASELSQITKPVIEELITKSVNLPEPAEIPKTNELMALEDITKAFTANPTQFAYSEDIYDIAKKYHLPPGDGSLRRLVKDLYSQFGKQDDFNRLQKDMNPDHKLRMAQVMLRALRNLVEGRPDDSSLERFKIKKSETTELESLDATINQLENASIAHPEPSNSIPPWRRVPIVKHVIIEDLNKEEAAPEIGVANPSLVTDEEPTAAEVRSESAELNQQKAQQSNAEELVQTRLEPITSQKPIESEDREEFRYGLPEEKTPGFRDSSSQHTGKEEYYGSFRTIQRIMEKYGRLDTQTLKKETGLNELLLPPMLEQSLQTMGFLDEYKKGLAEYKRSPAYQQRLVTMMRKKQDEWIKQGRSISEKDSFTQSESEIEFDLLVQAVESFYEIRPETLQHEEKKLQLPEGFEEVQYHHDPECIILRDTVTGYGYFGIPGLNQTWDTVPLPASIDIDKKEDIAELYTVAQQLKAANSRENHLGESMFAPEVRIVQKEGQDTIQVSMDRKTIIDIPVETFYNRDLVRSDVRKADIQNPIFKELLLKKYIAHKDKFVPNFQQKITGDAFLEDLILNTPLEGYLSFGDQAKLEALSQRILDNRKQRVRKPRYYK